MDTTGRHMVDDIALIAAAVRVRADAWVAERWVPTPDGWCYYVVTVRDGTMHAYRNGTACAPSGVPPEIMSECLDDDWRAANDIYMPPWLRDDEA